MQKKQFVFRNATVENLCSKFATEYSGYNDISYIPNDAEVYFWFYLSPIKTNVDAYVHEIETYIQQLQWVLSKIEPLKVCYALTMYNNELSGPLVTAFIYNKLKEQENRRYSYRFLFIPETIGSIAYLSLRGQALKERLIAGFVVTCIGDSGPFTYKKSRRGNAVQDRAVELLLKQTESDYTIHDFFPSGSDERQYCSPGFNLPVGSLMRSMYGAYPEYHTSGDNKGFISFDAMEQSVQKYLDTLHIIENNHTYLNKMPFCEPQLGKRGLYPTLGSQKKTTATVEAMMWLLNQADGSQDMIEIAQKSNCPIFLLIDVGEKLYNKHILEKINNNA